MGALSAAGGPAGDPRPAGGSGPAGGTRTEDAGWVPVDGVGAIARARRLAVEAATALGLPAPRVAELEIVVSEMASNLHKHAGAGAILVRRRRRAGLGGVQIIAVDAGPGMADPERSRRDGYSTTGTLGIGLGAIERLSTGSDLYTSPGRGTVMAAEFWPPGTGYRAEEVDGVTRPITGEVACGDGFAVRYGAAGPLLLLSDGLGHGPLAAAATGAAIDAFLSGAAETPAAAVELLHRRIRHTRGAAVGVAAVDRGAGTVRYAGLGNIAGHVVSPGSRRTMVSLPGIAGHQCRAVREFEYPLPPGAVVVLHSDGLTDRWDLDGYPGLLRRTPSVIAAVLLRDAGLRRDDAGVVVAVPPDPVADPR